MEKDKFIELDVKKLEHIEAERKKFLATEMQKIPEIQFMCCPRCSRQLVETNFTDMNFFICEQCKGIWMDDEGPQGIATITDDRKENSL